MRHIALGIGITALAFAGCGGQEQREPERDPVYAAGGEAEVDNEDLREDEDRREDAEPSDPVTAMDQSNDSSDLAITREIRQAVIADDRLSFQAKNVTVVTQDGVVTLRGSVDEEERTVIRELVDRVEGVRNVEEQLEIDGSE